MKRLFKAEVRKHLNKYYRGNTEILTDKDIAHLPGIVQKYLHHVGVVGKEKVWNFRAEFKGGIRGKSSEPFMKLKSVQYNFMEDPVRLFYIVARKSGIPAKGIHIYKDSRAIMRIKILGLIPVVNAHGIEMDKGETVTVFNDMCVMAPASLIDRNIEWSDIDTHTIKASFTNGNITISAILHFDNDGRLINFISNDRYETVDGRSYENYPWETPVLEYKNYNGFNLPSRARLIYKHPDEDFCYGEFELVSMEYNCRELK
jgi:hypothetical protein